MILSRGYGFANLEWDIPNTPDTKFRLGSISKQFTAACILRLEEQGKLSVTDPVKKYLDDAPAAWDKITLHHVLTPHVRHPELHGVSRVPHTGEATDYAREDLYSCSATSRSISSRERSGSTATPGYVLLSYLVEKISGNEYEDFLQAERAGSGGNEGFRLRSERAAFCITARPDTRHSAASCRTPSYIDMTIPERRRRALFDHRRPAALGTGRCSAARCCRRNRCIR